MLARRPFEDVVFPFGGYVGDAALALEAGGLPASAILDEGSSAILDEGSNPILDEG